MSYSQALEKQVALLDFIKSGSFATQARRMYPDWPAQGMAHVAQVMVENAETYWCAGDIADMLSSTAQSLPSESRMNCSMLPSRDGFMWFQRPLSGRMVIGNPVAVAWGYEEHIPVDDPRLIGPQDLGSRGPLVWVLWFMQTLEYPGLWPMLAFPWLDGQTAEQSIEFANQYDLLRFNPNGRDAWIVFERQWFLSALLFIYQRILVASQQRAERHTRRRIERVGWAHEPLIRVVELRRKQARSEHRGDSEPVEWSHQWIVSGHWRQQWYPSLNACQPRWIMPYVKGPEDKPLKPPRAKVFAVVR